MILYFFIFFLFVYIYFNYPLFEFFNNCPWWNSTRRTRNMIYDIRGEPITTMYCHNCDKIGQNLDFKLSYI